MGQKCLSGVTGSTIVSTVDDKQSTVGKGNELTHGTGFQHRVVLNVDRSGTVCGLGSDAMASFGGGVVPSVDEGPGVIAPGLIGHI